ncbi:uncharacterized protein MELLADRAFT_59634 [Melampsora larici-populina 98AG31]|uniref:Helitron helicase-like domain-containing protein n=1 Tax=Melampsora larici-populina (strain 98AG31 / pathotype 3-4-7) TaxID=747676 RepID=F4R888_MELLP|nr:uncharacterized protein MELLADRAFT_59634 [Melampsora larici-populina 98AG31]EGG11656.1 hypothetical protein MELLADRAFT_59634 [Melampsora larici-populina 98AG31]
MVLTRRVVCNTSTDNNQATILAKFQDLPYRLGKQDHECQYCGALRWGEERTKIKSKHQEETYSNCCQQGSVTLPWGEFEGPTVPDSLLKLYTGSDKDAKEFQQNITHYNNALSFTSLGVKVDQSVAGQKGINTFRVSGQLAHRIGSALPAAKKVPSYAQIYVVGDGGEGEVDVRLGHFKNKKLSKVVMLELQTILNDINPYAEFLKSSASILESQPSLRLMLKTLPPGKRELKTYNKPRPEDVAAIVESSETLDEKPRHIILHRKNNKLKHITDLSTGYLPLRYPLMLPFGSQQWDDNYVSPTAKQNNKSKPESTAVEIFRN